MRRVLLAAAVVAACGAGSAEAQTPDKHIDVSAGIGSAGGIGCDCYGSAPMYTESVRFDVSRHFAVETEFGRLGGSANDYTSPPGGFTNNAGAVVGQYQSALTHTADWTWAGAVSFLGHSTGRVSVFGGGGPGYAASHSDYITTFTGCSAPSQPQLCAGASYPRDHDGLTLHAVAGVEARATERVGGFVSFTAQAAYTAGPTHARALAGVRVRLR